MDIKIVVQRLDMSPASQIKDPVLEFIDSCFPGESDPQGTFIGMLENRTKDHEIFLTGIMGWLNVIIQELNKRTDIHGRRRFICKLDTTNRKKHWYSVAEKLWRESKKEEPKYDLKNFHRVMTDLLRLRVVCNFLSDIDSFKSALKQDYEGDTLKQENFLMEEGSDAIYLHPEERKSGHRSIKYLFTSKLFQGVFLELQIMTLFQEGWDQKDHYLIYEHKRRLPGKANENFSEYEDSLVHDMSGSLFVLDKLFDTIKKKLEEYHHEDS